MHIQTQTCRQRCLNKVSKTMNTVIPNIRSLLTMTWFLNRSSERAAGGWPSQWFTTITQAAPKPLDLTPGWMALSVLALTKAPAKALTPAAPPALVWKALTSKALGPAAPTALAPALAALTALALTKTPAKALASKTLALAPALTAVATLALPGLDLTALRT